MSNIMFKVGNTPLVRLDNIEAKYHLPFHLYAKLERANPSGSVKDRAAYEIISNAMVKGLIKEDSVVVEATSGNMGISLAMLSASLNIRCRIYMPQSASIERRKIMQNYGAEVILVNGGMKEAVEEALTFVKENPHAFYADQFNNIDSVNAHYKTTGPEIINQLNNAENKLENDMRVILPDYFVCGVGTGGTITGVAKRLKEKAPLTMVYGVEPANSPLLTKSIAHPHKIQGIGANFVPSILDLNLIDKILDVKDEDAYFFCKELSKIEGLFVGISSGAALAGVIKNIDLFRPNNNVVIILPDNGERYLSVEGLW